MLRKAYPPVPSNVAMENILHKVTCVCVCYLQKYLARISSVNGGFSSQPRLITGGYALNKRITGIWRVHNFWPKPLQFLQTGSRKRKSLQRKAICWGIWWILYVGSPPENGSHAWKVFRNKCMRYSVEVWRSPQLLCHSVFRSSMFWISSDTRGSPQNWLMIDAGSATFHLPMSQ